MTKRIDVPMEARGYGYVGRWRNGPVGWFMPPHLHKWNTRRDPHTNVAPRGTRSFLCKITVEPVLDSLGRPITKIHPEVKAT